MPPYNYILLFQIYIHHMQHSLFIYMYPYHFIICNDNTLHNSLANSDYSVSKKYLYATVNLRKEEMILFNLFLNVLLITRLLWLVGRLCARKPVYNTSGMTAVTHLTVLSRSAIVV